MVLTWICDHDSSVACPRCLWTAVTLIRMKERQPPSSPPALKRWEQRSIEGWENVRCLGRRFERSEQVEVVSAWLDDRQQARMDDTDDDLP